MLVFSKPPPESVAIGSRWTKTDIASLRLLVKFGNVSKKRVAIIMQRQPKATYKMIYRLRKKDKTNGVLSVRPGNI